MYSDVHGKGSVVYKFRVPVIELESLYGPNSHLNLVPEAGEVSPALERKVLFSVSGSSKNQTVRDIYIYIYIFIYTG